MCALWSFPLQPSQIGPRYQTFSLVARRETALTQQLWCLGGPKEASQKFPVVYYVGLMRIMTIREQWMPTGMRSVTKAASKLRNHPLPEDSLSRTNPLRSGGLAMLVCFALDEFIVRASFTKNLLTSFFGFSIRSPAFRSRLRASTRWPHR